jgi:hypothetical protein
MLIAKHAFNPKTQWRECIGETSIPDVSIKTEKKAFFPMP